MHCIAFVVLLSPTPFSVDGVFYVLRTENLDCELSSAGEPPTRCSKVVQFFEIQLGHLA